MIQVYGLHLNGHIYGDAFGPVCGEQLRDYDL